MFINNNSPSSYIVTGLSEGCVEQGEEDREEYGRTDIFKCCPDYSPEVNSF